MKVFVPVTDAELFGGDRPAVPMVPYQVGVPCFHWQIILDERDPAGLAENEPIIEEPLLQERSAS